MKTKLIISNLLFVILLLYTVNIVFIEPINIKLNESNKNALNAISKIDSISIELKQKDSIITSLKKRAAITGKASYYAEGFIGKKMANGKIFTANDLTCAHLHYKFGTKLKVTNLRNGKSIVVKVTDRGGFKKYKRIVDLSKYAFQQIANTKTGIINVKLEKV